MIIFKEFFEDLIDESDDLEVNYLISIFRYFNEKISTSIYFYESVEKPLHIKYFLNFFRINTSLEKKETFYYIT